MWRRVSPRVCWQVQSGCRMDVRSWSGLTRWESTVWQSWRDSSHCPSSAQLPDTLAWWSSSNSGRSQPIEFLNWWNQTNSSLKMHMNRSRHLLRNSEHMRLVHENRPSHCPCCLMVGHSQTWSGVNGCPGSGGSLVAWKAKLGAYSVQQRQSLQGHLWDSHSSQISGIGCWYAHTCCLWELLGRQAG